LEGLGLLRERRRLFISYRRVEASGVAAQLYEALDAAGFDVFLDTHGILRPGEPFQEVLWHRLADTDVALLLDTPGFLASRWTEEELARANVSNIQILQVLWPGQTEASAAAFSSLYPLSMGDFQSACFLGPQLVCKTPVSERWSTKWRPCEREQSGTAFLSCARIHVGGKKGGPDRPIHTRSNPRCLCAVGHHSAGSARCRSSGCRTLRNPGEDQVARRGNGADVFACSHRLVRPDRHSHPVDCPLELAERKYRLRAQREPDRRANLVGHFDPVGGPMSNGVDVRLFLSASVPLPSRNSAYFASADTVAIRDTIRAISMVVVERRAQLVFGGHPAITPMIRLQLTRAGLSVGAHVVVYQSRFFEQSFPSDNAAFERVELVEAVRNDRQASLSECASPC